MEKLAAAILHKYDIAYEGLTNLGGGTNTSWRVEGTPLVVRVADDSIDNGTLQEGLQAANAFTKVSIRFVTPAFPLVIQTETRDGEVARGTLWFYEDETEEKTDYRQLGQVVRSLQEQGSEVVQAESVPLPDALSVTNLRGEIESLHTDKLVDDATYELLIGWVPRIERGAEKLPASRRVVVHDDLWAKNTIMTPERGLVLCDPDNLAWGRADYDLAFISRGREAGVISREEVRAFEEGYGGKIPDINTAWRLAMFHRFRWVCHLLERQRADPAAAERLKTEIPLWRRKRGPQPG